MSKKYTYSRMIVTDEGSETFTADQFDSFDEAKGAVDRGIRDRRLELNAAKEATKKKQPEAPKESAPPPVPIPGRDAGDHAPGPVPPVSTPPGPAPSYHQP